MPAFTILPFGKINVTVVVVHDAERDLRAIIKFWPARRSSTERALVQRNATLLRYVLRIIDTLRRRPDTVIQHACDVTSRDRKTIVSTCGVQTVAGFSSVNIKNT